MISIAVGSSTFIEKVKIFLCFRAMGRDVEEGADLDGVREYIGIIEKL
jgi:hypothetical protein